MFGFKSAKCKRTLQRAMSDCFEPLKDELGTVPTALHDSKFITGSMLGICESYAHSNSINSKQKIALITDAVFEEVFRRESTNVQTQADRWLSENDNEFMSAYHQSKSNTDDSVNNTSELNIDWLKEYATINFEPSKNLML